MDPLFPRGLGNGGGSVWHKAVLTQNMEISRSENAVPYKTASQTGFWQNVKAACLSARWTDIFVITCILSFGGLHFFVVQRVADFQRDDVFYADASRSLIEHHIYGINGHTETNQPPGLPALLSFLCLMGGCSHLVFLRAMAVLETLGFFLTYELLRRQGSRLVAASICLLLISSRVFFIVATQWVFPSYPYFFTSMAALLAARKFERADNPRARFVWGALLTLLIVASLMFASAAIAFLGAIVASTVILYLWNRQRAIGRLKLYFAVFLIGAAVQGAWMARKAGPLEWPVPGYPRSYLAQLKVKSGNEPQLGMATLSDIPARILRNAADDSVLLSEAVLRRWIDVAWMSILVTGPIALILLGWGSAVWRRGGGLQDWYFVGYVLIYLLWPWKMESRFLLPIAPLACFYLWRGGLAIVVLAKNRPRLLALAWYPLGVVLAVSSWFWMHGSWIASHMTHAGFQDESSFAVWVLSSVLAMRILWAESSWRSDSQAFQAWLSKPFRLIGVNPLHILQLVGVVAVTTLTLIGLGSQIAQARVNLDPSSRTNSMPADVLAAEWLQSHTPPGAVIMARHVPTVYHYSGRNLVWFPPSSDPKLLMDGIKAHKIEFIVTVNRENNYYLPPENDCMAALLLAYPNAFDLIYDSDQFKVYRTVKEGETPHRNSVSYLP